MKIFVRLGKVHVWGRIISAIILGLGPDYLPPPLRVTTILLLPSNKGCGRPHTHNTGLDISSLPLWYKDYIRVQ